LPKFPNFAQILLKFRLNFAQKYLLGDAAASPDPTTLHAKRNNATARYRLEESVALNKL